jgi:hypothetical protein
MKTIQELITELQEIQANHEQMTGTITLNIENIPIDYVPCLEGVKSAQTANITVHCERVWVMGEREPLDIEPTGASIKMVVAL